MNKKPPRPADRKERLAKALKANLARRKAKARGLAASPPRKPAAD